VGKVIWIETGTRIQLVETEDLVCIEAQSWASAHSQILSNQQWEIAKGPGEPYLASHCQAKQAEAQQYGGRECRGLWAVSLLLCCCWLFFFFMFIFLFFFHLLLLPTSPVCTTDGTCDVCLDNEVGSQA
jgi:hypothetical protein